MKKLIIAIAIILLPLTSFGAFDTNLKYGSKGDAVVELQDFLQDQELYNGKIDGRFGLGTRKAVIAFQVNNGLKGDGFFGMKSRTKAATILTTILKPSEDAEIEETGAIAPTIVNNNALLPTMNLIIEEPSDTRAPVIYVKKMTDAWLGRFSSNEKFKGTVGLQAIYQDPLPSSGMIKVEFYLDGTLLGSNTTNLGPKIVWETTQFSNGLHTLTGKAYDKAGNIGTESTEVVIQND